MVSLLVVLTRSADWVGLNHGSIENSRSAVDVDSARRTSSGALGSRWRTCYASGGGLVGGKQRNDS